MTILCALLALLVANSVIANLVITITSLYDLTIYLFILYFGEDALQICKMQFHLLSRFLLTNQIWEHSSYAYCFITQKVIPCIHALLITQKEQEALIRERHIIEGIWYGSAIENSCITKYVYPVLNKIINRSISI